jgi:hypothetical protein
MVVGGPRGPPMLETIEMGLPKAQPGEQIAAPEASRVDPRVAYAEINNPSPYLAASQARLPDPSRLRAYLPL